MARLPYADFQQLVLSYYREHGRHELPWRQPDGDHFDPYKILVSELMLQQTQVGRVIPEYLAFLKQFPTVEALAGAPLAEVLTAWSGLGYNRRAKYLQVAAQQISSDFNGVIPSSIAELTQLAGVGINTAGAIAAYAFDEPIVFIETNIRQVYIHHFFTNGATVADGVILELLKATMDKEHPRQWFWALMDYGTHLKQTTSNAGRRSQNYSRQSVFKGSRRQIRGQVLKLLTTRPYSQAQLAAGISDDRLEAVLADLQGEQLIKRTADGYQL